MRRKYLQAGANALEPDVCFSSKPSHPDRYYVSHSHSSADADSYDFTPQHSLAQYMLDLKDLILRNNYKLAFIWFDYKDSPEGDINTFAQDCARQFHGVRPEVRRRRDYGQRRPHL
jgi:hypothetical protein